MRSSLFNDIEEKLSTFWLCKRNNFVGREQFIRELTKIVRHEENGGNQNVILVEGGPGAGKSAVAAVLQGNNAIPKLISYSFSFSHPDINTFGAFTEYICGCLQRDFNVPDVQALDPLDKLQSSLVAAANSPAAEENGHVYILLDGIEEFPEYTQLLKRLPRKEEIVYLLFAQPGVVKIDGIAKIQLPPLTRTDALKILENCFGESWGAVKSVADRVLEHEENLNPLILTEFASDFEPGTRITGDWWGQIKGLRSYFEKRTEDFDETTRGLLGALAYSYEPLSRPALEEFAHIDVPVLKKSMSLATRFVEFKDGAYEFRHNAWKTSAKDIFKVSGERFAVWSGENAYSETTNDLGYCLRWGPRHLIDFEKWEKASKLLSDFNYLMRRVKTQSLNSLLEEYARVGEKSQNRDFKAWHELMRKKGHALWRANKDWGAERILFQLAWDDGEGGPVNDAASKYSNGYKVNWDRLLKVRPKLKKDSGCLTLPAVGPAIELRDGRVLSYSNSDYSIEIFDASSGGSRGVLKGHSGHIQDVIELRDGRIVSCSSDKTLRIWDSLSGKCQAVLVGHTDYVSRAVELSNGRILSASGDKSLRVWDLSNGECQVEIKGLGDISIRFIVLRDDRILSWGHDDKTLRIWSTSSGECQAELKGHASIVFDVLELRNGRVLSCSSTLRIWDTHSGECLTELKGHPDSPVTAKPSDGISYLYAMMNSTHTCQGAIELRDGRILSWATDDNTLRIWDLSSGDCQVVIKTPLYDSFRAIELRDGRILSGIGSRHGRSLCIWDAFSGNRLAELKGHSDYIQDAIELRNGRILTASWDNTLRIWDSSDGRCQAVLTGHSDDVLGIKELQDGRILSWASDNDETLRIWDLPNSESCDNPMSTQYIEDAIELKDGKVLSWTEQGDMRILELFDSVQAAELNWQTAPIAGAVELRDGRILSWSRNGDALRISGAHDGGHSAGLKGPSGSFCGAIELQDNRILSWTKYGALNIWGAALSGDKCQRVLKGPIGPVYGAIELHDGRVLSRQFDGSKSIAEGGLLILWDVVNGKQQILREGAPVIAAIELRGGRILSVSADGIVQVFNASTGQRQEDYNTNIRFVGGGIILELRDGQILLCSNEDQMPRIWRPSSGEAPRELVGHASGISDAIELPDGRILTCSRDSTVRIWDSDRQMCVFWYGDSPVRKILSRYSNSHITTLLKNGEIVRLSLIPAAMTEENYGK